MMLPRIRFCSILCAVIALTTLLILTNWRFMAQTCYCPLENIQKIDMKPTEEDSIYLNQSLSNIEEILNTTRSKIRSEVLSSKNFPSKIDGYVIESGGKPLRFLIISSWRSGSSFLGDIVNSIPGTFYHYEPLLPLGIKKIKGPPLSVTALNTMKKVYRCNFKNMTEYFEFGRKDSVIFSLNKRLWDYCVGNKELCYDADFVSKFCGIFPIQTMKLVRMRLQLILDIMEDDDYDNMKVILLTRDPRAVMQSRSNRVFCKRSRDCIDPKALCADMASDHLASTQFLMKYPDRFMALRYEELALNPKSTASRILKFLNQVPAMPVVEQYLKYHTSMVLPGVISTYRVSQDVPFKWKKIMDFDFVKEIQTVCEDAMALWGYTMAHNATHMRSEGFKPLEEYIFT